MIFPLKTSLLNYIGPELKILSLDTPKKRKVILRADIFATNLEIFTNILRYILYSSMMKKFHLNICHN